jgi:hypothetical protein
MLEALLSSSMYCFDDNGGFSSGGMKSFRVKSACFAFKKSMKNHRCL